MQLVRLVHGLQLQEAGILVTAQDAAPGARDGGEDPGDGYLLTGAATLRTNIAIAIRRLLNALRAHQFPFGERLVVVIAPESEAQDALQEALDIRRTA